MINYMIKKLNFLEYPQSPIPIPNPHSIVDKVIINEYINNYLIKIPIIKIIINNNVILFLRIVEYNLNKNNINLYIKKSIISFIL